MKIEDLKDQIEIMILIGELPDWRKLMDLTGLLVVVPIEIRWKEMA